MKITLSKDKGEKSKQGKSLFHVLVPYINTFGLSFELCFIYDFGLYLKVLYLNKYIILYFNLIELYKFKFRHNCGLASIELHYK